ncbi:hypothetical protein [Synechococcus sp. PCC 6312]|uniref:hypothetical protein n=1 Tax=Synechococcus sp. (strain ATCC 27167 / PCC 6312) TaxID=195253 RepID=UPI00029F2117|nr:hypothetical protein [Synechococcus sp. PCC 6312]AFY61905.1 hypothetical protein Syn6312_2832 [Synechococcus sp. PCC 6312]
MTSRKSSEFRQFHQAIAPLVALPLLLTAITGSIYQITDLSGNESKWLLEMDKGIFGILKPEAMYPFLNALGLFALLGTGISMWL